MRAARGGGATAVGGHWDSGRGRACISCTTTTLAGGCSSVCRALIGGHAVSSPTNTVPLRRFCLCTGPSDPTIGVGHKTFEGLIFKAICRTTAFLFGRSLNGPLSDYSPSQGETDGRSIGPANEAVGQTTARAVVQTAISHGATLLEGGVQAALAVVRRRERLVERLESCPKTV